MSRIQRRYQFFLADEGYPSQDVLDRHGSFTTLARAVEAAKAEAGKHRRAIVGATISRGSGEFFRRSRVVSWDPFAHRHWVRNWSA